MRLTKKLFLGVCPLALCIAPAFAQSTGTQEIETVVVTGTRVSLSGLRVGDTVAKQRSTITSDFLNTQVAGQTVFQALNFMPGINFTNNDPYGTSGGNIRVHGQDGNHIALTLDGMPLNDTGNYAIYTNQMPDSEVVDRITANQTSTDVDSPTAAASGGVIAIVSDKPHEDFGMMGGVSGGSFSYQRYFIRVDSGKIGPWGTQLFAAYSYQDYDKWRGSGMQRKQQANVKLYQDLGDIGWFSLSAHWNANRNNNYSSINYMSASDQVVATTYMSNSATVLNGSHGYTGNAANSYNATEGYGWDQDMQSTCSSLVNKTSSTNYCSYWYKFRINPSNTGNIRFASLWHLADALTLTVDANLQYVLATGGSGNSNYKETDARLIGGTSGGSGTTTTANGCIAGVGCDLDGDGVVSSSTYVTVQSPSLTNTRRWGYNMSLIYRFDENNTLQAAYTLDYGLHRQTGQNAFASLNGVHTPFGGSTDHEHRVFTADHYFNAGAGDEGILRYRDRKSKAILNQPSMDYEGKYFDGMLNASIGFRLPFLERDLNQYCYQAINSSNPWCSGQAVSSRNTDGTVYLVNGGTQKYVDKDLHKVVRYNKFLPHVGLTVTPFDEEHLFFASFAKEISAPKTDNLYQVAKDNTTGQYTPFYLIKAETSTNYTLGYRYLGEALRVSLVGWTSQIKNRIVSSWDESTQSSTYHVIDGVNASGVDLDASYDATSDLTFYGSVTYNHSNILSNIELSQGVYADTKGKQLIESPDWMLTGRVQYSLTGYLKMGLDAKYVGRRFGSEDNNYRIPDYFTVNADATFDLDSIGMDNSSIRVNVTNLFDKHYFGSLSSQAGQTCWNPASSNSNDPCHYYPALYTGAPRAVQVNLVLKY